jgi:YD repeat-containing protein
MALRAMTFLSDTRGRAIRQIDAAGARDTFIYDGADRLVKWKTRRTPDSLTFAYDSLGRLQQKVVSGTGGGTWTHRYHQTFGTLDTIRGPADTIRLTRNSWGWVTQEKAIVNGVTRTVGYSYNQAGSLTAMTDPWGGSYSYGWDLSDTARTITNPFSESFRIRHSREGLITTIVFPAGADPVNQSDPSGLDPDCEPPNIEFGNKCWPPPPIELSPITVYGDDEGEFPCRMWAKPRDLLDASLRCLVW